MTGHHYPDHFYADALARDEKPLGAYASSESLVKRVRVLPLVSEDLHKRIAKGAGDYGEPLTTHNGRDPLWDAYEEALDLCLYLRQAIEERKAPEPTIAPEHIPKWHRDWPNTPPNCDGLSARDIRAPHPMQAEAIRDHDERLAGGESHL